MANTDRFAAGSTALGARMPNTVSAPAALLSILSLLLSGCGGGDGGGLNRVVGGGSRNDWTPGVFLPAATFQARCVAPRSGNNPNGNPWPDIAGTVLDENNWIRSWHDDTYLWYSEVTDVDPGLFDDPETYFGQLRTRELLPSGAPKDSPQFHFTENTDEWLAQSQSGVSGGYGAQWAVIAPAPPRQILVAYTDPDTPATANGLLRGAEVLAINGVDAVNEDTQAGVDVLNAGLFPAPGESYDFEVRDPDGTVRSFSLQAELITSTPVQNVGTIATATGDVGYLLFNDHIAIAEQQLIDAVSQLAAAGVSDLVLDVRYNGGGFLAIGAQLAYMIAGPAQTAGRTFELQQFNDKYPSTNPVTGDPIQPVPFYDQTLGFSAPAGSALPTLDLSRVYVITGGGSCSASEAIINGLRGANVEVVQIGSTTCGKPYGFYPTDNCGTTYFAIQFRGVNDQDFGDYADGFAPENASDPFAVSLPGCSVGDDFGSALGDPVEARLAAALQHREFGTCPAASGSATPPRLSRLRLDADDTVRIPRAPWRENRIMTRP